MINKEAQEIIDRIAIVAENYGEVWDEQSVRVAMAEYYAELGVPMPNIVVVDDLVLGYKESAGAARDAARGAAWNAAWDAAWGAAWDAAWGAARGAAWDAAWGAAATNTGLKDSATLKFIAIESKLLKALESGLMALFPMQDKLILVPMPKLRVQNGVLHSELYPAVEWRNGTSFYFLFGVRFEKELWKKITSGSITAGEIFRIENAEQKSVAMRVYGYEKMIQNADVKRLSETGVMVNGDLKKYEVLEVDLKDDDVLARFVKVVCWSTGKETLLRVDPRLEETKDPFGAIAWTAGLTKDEYKMEIET